MTASLDNSIDCSFSAAIAHPSLRTSRDPCYCCYGSSWSEDCNHCSYGDSSYGHSLRSSGVCDTDDGAGLGQTPRVVEMDAQAMYGADHRSFQMLLATLSLGGFLQSTLQLVSSPLYFFAPLHGRPHTMQAKPTAGPCCCQFVEPGRPLVWPEHRQETIGRHRLARWPVAADSRSSRFACASPADLDGRVCSGSSCPTGIAEPMCRVATCSRTFVYYENTTALFSLSDIVAPRSSS